MYVNGEYIYFYNSAYLFPFLLRTLFLSLSVCLSVCLSLSVYLPLIIFTLLTRSHLLYIIISYLPSLRVSICWFFKNPTRKISTHIFSKKYFQLHYQPILQFLTTAVVV